MKNLEQYQQFALGKEKLIASDNRRCVLYSRVSTTMQEDNTSLESQIQACRKFAEASGFEIVEEFGGKGESAKAGSSRKEYERMLKFVKSKANKIRYIVFYSYDRFSREGGKAIVAKEELKAMGILIKSATLNIDTESPIGSTMEDFQLLMGKLDNDTRRSKCMVGTIATLKKGKWCGTAPIGYRWDKNKGMLLIDEVKGSLVRRAFQWKNEQPEITNEEIRARLKNLGLDVPRQTMSALLSNPLYAGLITHSLIPDQVYQGLHEPIISPEIFTAINDQIAARNTSGWRVDEENNSIALKRFMLCEDCGTPLTGYIVQKKGIHYYKCRTKGCGVNKNASALDSLFLVELQKYEVKSNLVPFIERELRATMMDLNSTVKEDEARFQKSIDAIDTKLKGMREKLVVEGSITRAEHDEFAIPFLAEKEKIEKEFRIFKERSSNQYSELEAILQMIANLAFLWENGTYRNRQTIQIFAFPDGMVYNRKLDTVRTKKVNYIVSISSKMTAIMSQKEKGRGHQFGASSRWVAPAGIEPASRD